MRAWIALLVAAAVAAGLLAFGEPVARALRYERDAILDGQVWRALTAHLVHLSWAHLGVNVAVAALVVGAFGRHFRWGVPLLCALGTSAGLFLGALRVKWYAGLSGVLHGLIVFGALAAWRRDRKGIWLVALVLVALKIVLEQVRGAPGGLADLIGAPIAVEGHLWGAVSGAVAFLLLYRPSRSRL